MENQSVEQSVQVGIAEQIFTNAPNMLVLCLTVIGLIKIYTRFEKITTLADNFLAFVSIGFLGRHGSFLFGYTREEKLAADETRPPSGFALFSFAHAYGSCSDVHDLCAGGLVKILARVPGGQSRAISGRMWRTLVGRPSRSVSETSAASIRPLASR